MSSTATQTFQTKSVLKRTSAIIAGNLSVFMAIAAMLGLPALIVRVIVGSGGHASASAHVPAAILFGIIPFFCNLLLQIALVRISVNYLNGSSTTLKEALSFDAKQIIALLLINLAVAVLTTLVPPRILLIGAGPLLWILAGCCVSIPLCIIEDANFLDALNRSWEATEGYRWKILGLLVIYLAIVVLLDSAGRLALGIPLGAVKSMTAPYEAMTWLIGIVGTVLSTTGLTAIYFELAPSRTIPASLRVS